MHVPTVDKLSREEVLQHLAKFPEGLTFTEIQRFIVEWHGLDYDEMTPSTRYTESGLVPCKMRTHRGWWCDNLLGSSYGGRVGILKEHCDKIGKRYVLKKHY